MISLNLICRPEAQFEAQFIARFVAQYAAMLATLAGQVFLGAEWEKQLNSENMAKENKRTEQTR